MNSYLKIKKELKKQNQYKCKQCANS